MFEGIKYVSEPVVHDKPKHPKDLPKLVDVLKKLTIEDPNLVVKIATNLIRDNKVEIVTSEPLINYRETIKGTCSR